MYLPQRRTTARRQMQVSQAGTAGSPPEVLLRFHQIVGAGNVTGPYRGYLFYWKTTRNDVIDAIALSLWPFLSAEKRRQFEAMTRAAGRELPIWPTAARQPAIEIAWTAGLFDSEGSVLLSGARGRPFVKMELPQASADGVPETLERFRTALGAGFIGGPYPPRSPWSRLPQYRWSLGARSEVTRVLELMWPWLSTVKRAQAEAKRRVVNPGRAT
ncbi:MAG TPA: hypothetical protein VEU77_01665 [Candidatus Acidoferrales bacterium]|nr:hypothetical protein [Candidatus Acidoferrales bacterium]